ncbi:MAG: Asp-tRNA(Asn)/Glu-tRNA(Gln) amidotransferase subunit GatB [Anaerolineae bacterium]
MTRTRDYEAVIGLEVHAELMTESKMFCGCSAAYHGAEPNTLVCPVCLGMPGSLPVINKRGIEFTVRTALALNCEIAELAKFDRKNYHYPDLPKGYQISQYDMPLSGNGWLEIEVDGQARRIGVRRVHLEEDTAKLTHVDGYSLVDFNRSGVPLLEIVTEPDIRSPDEAREYSTRLRHILRWIGVSTGDMEAGALRIEPNISVRSSGSEAFGTRTEIKNLNSIRAVAQALEYEIRRQIDVLESGGAVVQQTMGWDEDRGITVAQRSKEFAEDYRYFPEPDLPPLVLKPAWIDQIREALPELPEERRRRYMKSFGLSAYDAGVLTANRATGPYFERAVACYDGDPKNVANWVTGELFRVLNDTGTPIEESPVEPEVLADLLHIVDRGVISVSKARDVFQTMVETGKGAQDIVEERGLRQISDEDKLLSVIDGVIRENPQPVEDYLNGKETAITFLIGQVMRATRGQANPSMVRPLLERRLAAPESAISDQ